MAMKNIEYIIDIVKAWEDCYQQCVGSSLNAFNTSGMGWDGRG